MAERNRVNLTTAREVKLHLPTGLLNCLTLQEERTG